MKNRHVRQRRSSTREQISSEGLSYRRFEVGEKTGQIARMRIGKGVTAKVVTLEQQPGHSPVAFVQGVAYNPTNPNGYLYRPRGEARNISSDRVWDMIRSASEKGIDPVDVGYFAVASMFFPEEADQISNPT
jgi:hypothetical protein